MTNHKDVFESTEVRGVDFTFTKYETRFQDLPRHVKFWRFRFYLLIPYYTLKLYYHNGPHVIKDPDDYMLFKECWSCAVGLAQVQMNWLYDLDLKKLIESINNEDEHA